ncbi:hypothetical protein HDU96_003366 [Phlyctochytrium bullatum]|nr:hypothetical protein HDU96_003366 [Phlyctochytrium bullatum]
MIAAAAPQGSSSDQDSEIPWAVTSQDSTTSTIIENNASPDPHPNNQQQQLDIQDDHPGKASSVDIDATAVEDAAPDHGLSKLQFALVFVGLALAVFLAALDETIVAVALPVVANEFQSLDQVGWIGTAYLLTATSFIPSYGQLADIFGRKPVFLFAIFAFELGSALCGAAWSMNVLILARAIAGVGSAGIYSIAIVIISDLVPIRQRANYQGIIGAVFGLAGVTGPLLGGSFVDHISWRWVFYINLPIGVITVGVVLLFLRFQNPTAQPQESLSTRFLRIDWLGTFLLIAAVIFILIPLQGGGSLYTWDSPTVISLLVLGSLFLAAFIYVEGWVASNPVVPFSLFRNVHVVGTFATSLMTGMCFTPLVFYAPLWCQAVFGSTATEAGLRTIPLILGVVLFSLLAGAVASATGHYMPFLPLSGAVVALGAGLLSTLDESSPIFKQILYLLIAGIGVGFSIQTVLLAAQAAVEPELLSVVTTNTNFWQLVGNVLGLAIVSSVFNNKLAKYFAEETRGMNFTLPAGVTPEIFLKSIESVRKLLPPEQQGPVVRAYVRTLSLVFWITVAFRVVLFGVSWFVKKERLPTDKKEKGEDA